MLSQMIQVARKLPCLTFTAKIDTACITCCCLPSRAFHTSSRRERFTNQRKGDYKYDKYYKTNFKWEWARDGLKRLPDEFKELFAETKEMFSMDPEMILPGDMRKEFEFTGPDCLDEWVVTADSDHNEGFSTASLTATPAGHACFSGTLSTRLPKDGIIKSAGFVNMKSLARTASFERVKKFDWQAFNHVVMRVRGDGRTYLLNLHTPGHWDVTWLDMSTYVLPTRGGPYWQDVKIPFGNFFFHTKGRINDKQRRVDTTNVKQISITLADNNEGSFRLEIDYIGVLNDPNGFDELAYESYVGPKFVVNV